VFGWTICNTFPLQRNLITLKYVWYDWLRKKLPGNHIRPHSPPKHSFPCRIHCHYATLISHPASPRSHQPSGERRRRVSIVAGAHLLLSLFLPLPLSLSFSTHTAHSLAASFSHQPSATPEQSRTRCHPSGSDHTIWGRSCSWNAGDLRRLSPQIPFSNPTLPLLIQDLQSCGAEEEEEQGEQGFLRRLCGKVNPSLPCLFRSVDPLADLVTVTFEAETVWSCPRKLLSFFTYVGI
jgi:hypothetical protein